jgi:hypothetical protein
LRVIGRVGADGFEAQQREEAFGARPHFERLVPVEKA